MSDWISSAVATPSRPGWYSTLSNWRTATRHPGAKQWLGTKWATSCPERIEYFAPTRFDDPVEATGRAFDIPEPAASTEAEPMARADAPLAAAAA